MAVDNNFERLEEKLTHLVEVMSQLQEENAALKGRAQSLESENEQLQRDSRRLQEVETGRKLAKERVQKLLERLDQLEL